jgi:hypothetical protein
MRIDVQRGVVGQVEGCHWGLTPTGKPVLMVVGAGVQVRIEMSAGEVKDHGVAACYMAIEASLKAPAADAGALRPSSSLVGADGLPLMVQV